MRMKPAPNRRQLDLFFNELSVPFETIDQKVAEEIVGGFLRLLSKILSFRKDLSLNSRRGLFQIQITTKNPQTTLGILMKQNWREEWRLISRLEDRSPSIAALSPEDNDFYLFEYSYNGRKVEGLGLACFMDTAALSLPFAEEWKSPNIHLSRTQLDSDSGEILPEDHDHKCRHMALPEHATYWKQWFEDYGLRAMADADTLWNNRSEQFPGLRFLARVYRDLSALDKESFTSMRGQLAKLSRAIIEWGNHASDTSPNYLTKVTSESESRKHLFEMMDVDGETYCFELHARYTPGAGRIHFRLDQNSGNSRTAVVAYIGPKLSRPISG